MELSSRKRWTLLMFALSAVVYFPLADWLATTSIGTRLLLELQFFYLFPLLVAILSLPVLAVMLCLKRTRPRARPLLILAIVYIVCCLVGGRVARSVRRAGMHAATERAQPLVAAIERFERERGEPPKALEDLVPEYLPTVPSTGMMAYPKFRYHTGDEAQRRYENNPWALSIFTPSYVLNWDMMLYLPKQNYPERGYGGSLERIGDWAYVHE